MEYNYNKKSIWKWIIIYVVAAIVIYGLVYYFFFAKNGGYGSNNQTQTQTSDWKTYDNTKYGFELTFPDSWKGYSVTEQTWQGMDVNGSGKTYSGPEILIKNPQTTPTQAYQDIPIMVFTLAQWQLITSESMAVSAAPIGPAKVGENATYVFATPPRWYGFTDAIGFDEAVSIVKTFNAY